MRADVCARTRVFVNACMTVYARVCLYGARARARERERDRDRDRERDRERVGAQKKAR